MRFLHLVTVWKMPKRELAGRSSPQAVSAVCTQLFSIMEASKAGPDNSGTESQVRPE